MSYFYFWNFVLTFFVFLMFFIISNKSLNTIKQKNYISACIYFYVCLECLDYYRSGANAEKIFGGYF